MAVAERILALSAAPAPSGGAALRADRILTQAAAWAGELTRSPLGGVCVRARGKKAVPRLLLTAPMDTPGFVVTGQRGGFLRLSPLGGAELRALPAQELRLLTPEPVSGVVCAMPPHVLRREDMELCPGADAIWLDTGHAGEIPLGTFAVFAGECRILGRRISAPGAGNTAAAAAVLEAASLLQERAPELPFALGFTAQHRLGSRDAAAVCRWAEPEIILAVDTVPEDKAILGKGPALTIGPCGDRSLLEELEARARELRLPVQRVVVPGHCGSDLWVMQTAGTGAVCARLAIPTRYPDTPVEMVDLDDCAGAAALLASWCAGIREEAEPCWNC